MKRYPAGAGCDDDPRRGWDRRRGDVPDWAVVVPFSCRRPQRLFADARRPENASDGLKPSLCVCTARGTGTARCTNPSPEITERATECTVPSIECTDSSHLAQGCDKRPELGTEAAEILISPSGGVPAARGEAAATEGPEGPRRQAVRSRGGRGARLTGGIGR